MRPHRPPARASSLLLCCLGAFACAKPTEVELRLYPCELASEAPVRVDLEISGRDAAGAAMPPLTAGFEIADASVLADGYATVGLRKPDGMVEADFKLTWSYASAGAAVALLSARAVPAAGEVLELGAEECAPVDAGTSTGDSSSSTGDSSSTSTGDSSSTGDSTSTGSSSTGDTSTSTGDTSTSTGDSSTSTGDATTGEPSMLGDDCTKDDFLFCENAGPGELGTILLCVDEKWTLGDPAVICAPIADFCPTAKLLMPVAVGCANEGALGFSCACRDEPAVPCVELENGCGGNQEITFCHDFGDGSVRLKGTCVGLCMDQGEGPYCVPN